MIFCGKGLSKRMKFAQDLFCCNTILCQTAATAFLFPMFRTVLMSEWGTFWRVWPKQISSLWIDLSNAALFVLIGCVRAEFWILSEFLLCLNLNFWIVKQMSIIDGLSLPKTSLNFEYLQCRLPSQDDWVRLLRAAILYQKVFDTQPPRVP